jgi:hypothetical protein
VYKAKSNIMGPAGGEEDVGYEEETVPDGDKKGEVLSSKFLECGELFTEFELIE